VPDWTLGSGASWEDQLVSARSSDADGRLAGGGDDTAAAAAAASSASAGAGAGAQSSSASGASSGRGIAGIKETVHNAVVDIQGSVHVPDVQVFSMLGKGGFGVVYHGALPCGHPVGPLQPLLRPARRRLWAARVGRWKTLEVAIKTVLFQTAGGGGRTGLTASEAAIATEAAIAMNLCHHHVVATYSHDVCSVPARGDSGAQELGIFKFYLIQVRSPIHAPPCPAVWRCTALPLQVRRSALSHACALACTPHATARLMWLQLPHLMRTQRPCIHEQLHVGCGVRAASSVATRGIRLPVQAAAGQAAQAIAV
jgi:hypothetical protein